MRDHLPGSRAKGAPHLCESTSRRKRPHHNALGPRRTADARPTHGPPCPTRPTFLIPAHARPSSSGSARDARYFAVLYTLPVAVSVQYTLVASTAIPPGSSGAGAIVTGEPPAMGTLRTLPRASDRKSVEE